MEEINTNFAGSRILPDNVEWASKHVGVYQEALTGLRGGVIIYQACSGCAAVQFPAGTVCRSCGSVELHGAASSGGGVVYSLTRIPRRDSTPQVIALVDLDDGFRIMATVVEESTESVGIGDHVQLARDYPALVFRPTFRKTGEAS